MRMSDLATTTIAEELRANTAHRMQVMAADDYAAIDKGIEDLKAGQVGAGHLKVGATAPAFELPNALGQPVRLSELTSGGPVVLSFFRGGWCSYCNIELRALQRYLTEIRDLGAELIAVTPELPDETVSTAEKLALSYPVLSDSGNQVARAFGLVMTVAEELRPLYSKMGIELPARNGDNSFELPLPGTFVIDRDGTILQAFVDPDYRNRVEPMVILETLRHRNRD